MTVTFLNLVVTNISFVFFLQVKPLMSEKEHLRLPDALKPITVNNYVTEKSDLQKHQQTNGTLLQEKVSDSDLKDNSKKGFQLPPLV